MVGVGSVVGVAAMEVMWIAWVRITVLMGTGKDTTAAWVDPATQPLLLLPLLLLLLLLPLLLLLLLLLLLFW